MFFKKNNFFRKLMNKNPKESNFEDLMTNKFFLMVYCYKKNIKKSFFNEKFKFIQKSLNLSLQTSKELCL